MRKVYVASSWRNMHQPFVVEALRVAGHEVYDFKNPAEGNQGFHWSEIDPEYESWSSAQFIEALEHPIAEAGFRSDFGAMRWADTCVLVLPSNRSAHIEAGWMAGQHKRLVILLPESNERPELMYKIAQRGNIVTTIADMLEALGDGVPLFAGVHPAPPEPPVRQPTPLKGWV